MNKRKRARRTTAPQADMTCERVTSLIVEYLTEELDAAIASAFEAHLRDCPDCVAFLNTYRKTVRVTRSLPYEEVPSEMVSRVRQFLQARIRPSPPRQ